MGIEMLPKPVGGSPIPLYVTGHCGQTPEWIAEHGDGWMYYGQDLARQRVNREHRSIIEALEVGDVDRAIRELEEHRQHAVVDLKSRLQAPA